MCDIEQGVNKEYLRMYESASIHMRRRMAELEFLDLHISSDHKKPYDDDDDDDDNNKVQLLQSRDEFTSMSFSFPYWTTTHTDIIYEASSPLQDSAVCMQTLGDFMDRMSESSYELSFKDFLQEDSIMDEKENCEKTDKSFGINEKHKKKSVARSESTGTERLLLKFSLTSEMKSNRKCSKEYSERFGEGYEKTGKKRWWKISCLEKLRKASRADMCRRMNRSCFGSLSSRRRWYVCKPVE